MLNIFPYIFSTTFNIVDNMVNNIINSEFVEDLVDSIDKLQSVDINFKEHKRGYTLYCYLPGVKKENIELSYDNNYITLKIKRNMFYTNNQNIAIKIIQPGGDIEEDYYVENADPNGIRAVFKDDALNVFIPKSTYISKDTTIIDVDSYENKS